MNRVTRMGIGLVALIPVLAIVGWLFGAAGVDGEARAWLVLGVGVVWIALVIWWGLRAPAQLTEEFRGRYLSFLRQAEFRPLDDRDEDRAKTNRR